MPAIKQSRRTPTVAPYPSTATRTLLLTEEQYRVMAEVFAQNGFPTPGSIASPASSTKSSVSSNSSARRMPRYILDADAPGPASFKLISRKEGEYNLVRHDSYERHNRSVVFSFATDFADPRRTMRTIQARIKQIVDESVVQVVEDVKNSQAYRDEPRKMARANEIKSIKYHRGALRMIKTRITLNTLSEPDFFEAIADLGARAAYEAEHLRPSFTPPTPVAPFTAPLREARAPVASLPAPLESDSGDDTPSTDEPGSTSDDEDEPEETASDDEEEADAAGEQDTTVEAASEAEEEDEDDGDLEEVPAAEEEAVAAVDEPEPAEETAAVEPEQPQLDDHMEVEAPPAVAEASQASRSPVESVAADDESDDE